MWINIAYIVKAIIFSFDLKIIYISFTDFFNTPLPPPPILNFTEFCPVVAELFLVRGRTDGQTDGMDEAYVLCIICFSNPRKSGKENEGAREGE